MRLYLRYVGLVLCVLGVTLVVSGFVGITGFSILDSFSVQARSLLGVLLFIVGIVLTRHEGANLEGKIDVYDSKSQKGDKGYHMVDPYLNFGRSDVTIAEFKEGVKKIEKDGELMEIVRGEYTPPLVALSEAGGEKAKIAREFLQVLGHMHKEAGQENYHGLSDDEKKEIKVAFRDYSGHLTKQQRKILSSYGISFEVGHDTHWHFKSPGSDRALIASHTSSDWRSGRNLASSLIKMIEDSKGKKS